MEEFLKKSAEERKKEATLMLNKYADRIPVIMIRNKKSQINPTIKIKYLVPKKATIAEFIIMLRKYIILKETQSLYVLIDNIIPPSSATIEELYRSHKNEDGFLYIIYSGENVFG